MDKLEKVQIGVIADDFTGASDAASFLQKGGLTTVLLNGVPDNHQALYFNDYQVVVIALKTRTVEVTDAVQQSFDAFDWLEGQGADRYLFKYCSTMDSTAKGNIGPVLDALIERTGVDYALVSPALPVNGRVVKEGQLYVNGLPLDESPMRHHPLTPMWTSDIAEIMEAQGQYASLNITHKDLEKGSLHIKEKLKVFGNSMQPFYIITDFESDDDGQRIMELFGPNILLSGSSGYMEAYAAMIRDELNQDSNQSIFGSETRGPAIILAGSVSEATRGQVAYYKESGGDYFEIDPLALIDGSATSEDIWLEITESISNNRTVLVYSAHAPEAVQKAQAYGKLQVGELIEQVLSDIVEKSYALGYKRIIVAGGETSGAITQRLGFDTYSIEESIAPGVPVMVPLQDTEVRLILKSGNFGQEDFFERALQVTSIKS